MRRSLIAAVVGSMALAAAVVVAPVVSAAPAQHFQTCEEAIAAGFHDVPASDAAYRAELDLDSDGVACEEDDPATTGAAAPEESVVEPAPAAPSTPEPPAAVGVEPLTEVQGATAERAAQDELAHTGASIYTPVIAAMALALFLAGNWFMRAGHERLDWLSTRQPDVRFTIERSKRRR